MRATDKVFFRNGQAFLALVFFIGTIIILVGVTIAFLVNSSIDTGYGYQASEQAETVATAGAEDGLLQLVRNSGFATTSTYNLFVGGNTAVVKVTQNSPIAGKVTVLSTAAVSGRTRRVNVVLVKDPSTGQLQVISWQSI